MRFKPSFGHFVLLTSALLVSGTGYLIWSGYQFCRSEFPNVAVLKSQYPRVQYRGKETPPLVRMQKSRPPGWVGLSEVSRVAVGAIVVSEDWAFYQHKGYDANQMKEAIKEDWEAGRFVRGASTITQQVVRNVFLDKDKNIWRKLKELILAVDLEKEVGKKKILETYLNIAEWGEGIFGIGPASRFYFGKSPSELSAKEGAFLAMLLPSPKRYGQSFRRKEMTRYAQKTVNSILGKMTQAHYIDGEILDRERALPLSFEARAATADLNIENPPNPPEGDEELGTDEPQVREIEASADIPVTESPKGQNLPKEF